MFKKFKPEVISCFKKMFSFLLFFRQFFFCISTIYFPFFFFKNKLYENKPPMRCFVTMYLFCLDSKGIK